MGERIQPGGRVDKDVYHAFRQYVKDRHGAVRGNMGRELEKAMREHMSEAQGPGQLDRIENDIAALKAQIADAEGDGGPEVTPRTHAHADNTTNDKPQPNAPRAEKVSWLVDEMYDRSGGSVTPEVIQKHVKDKFSFGERTAEKYVQAVIDELDAQIHPNDSKMLIWGGKIDEVRAELSEDGT